MTKRAARYKNFIAFKSLFYFCSLPLRLDSYRGCTYGCLYCFSRSLNNRSPKAFSKPVPASPAEFKHLMNLVQENRQDRLSLPRSCLQRRVPIHFGCTSDPLQPCECNYRVTLEFLKILNAYQYPFVLSTKSDLITQPDYLSLIRSTPAAVQFSFATLDEQLSERIEPVAPPPTARLAAMNTLSALGIWTIARWQPFLYPKEEMDSEVIAKFAEAGARHVIVEHLRIPTNSRLRDRRSLWSALGVNFLQFYHTRGIRHSRVNFELASKHKINNVIQAKKEIHRFGMSFGAGDNDFHHFSDALCCCGVPPTEHFKHTYKGHLGYGAFNAIRTGEVSFAYLDKVWQPQGSAIEYLNSDCRLPDSNRVVDLLKDRIENPDRSNSPTDFYGIEYLPSQGYTVNQDIRSAFCGGVE
jgi:DNA repair photolyase